MMLHIATVHWGTNFFKDVQYKFIKKNMSNFKIWTFSDKIPEAEKNVELDLLRYYFCEESGEWNHRVKLNMLANLISKEANNEDVILFLDGDAWPIAPINEIIKNTLDNFCMGAVIRSENGEKHAHPCFMFTKVGFWKENNLNWKEGKIGDKKYDVGYITHLVKSKKLDWHRFSRTRGLTGHKVFFSIYGDILYHHGAGFRAPVSGYCQGIGLKMSKDENLSMLNCFLSEFDKN